MVELEGNKSENSNVSQNLKGDFTSFQQKVKQRNPCELQPSNTLGRSKRGAPQLIPENEVGHSANTGFDRFSFTYWKHQNKMRPWHAVTRGEYKLWTNAGGTILFTAARRYPSENYRARSPSPQDVTWRDSWSQRDEEEDAMMTNWSTWKYSVIPIIWEPHILLCLGPKNWNTWLGYGQEKKSSYLAIDLMVFECPWRTQVKKVLAVEQNYEWN